MTSARLLAAVAILGVLGGACAGDDPGGSPGTAGGAGSGTAGTSGGAGTTGGGVARPVGAAPRASPVSPELPAVRVLQAQALLAPSARPVTQARPAREARVAAARSARPAAEDGVAPAVRPRAAAVRAAARRGAGTRAVDPSGAAGIAGSGGTGTGGAGGSGAATKSAGCGKPLGTLKSGKYTITSSGSQRSYIIDIPANYDMNHAYRLFFTFHWIGSTSEAVRDGQTSNGGAANWGYYGLKRMATSANDPAIFIAPQSMGTMWGQQDHPFFDDMLALAKEQLCIDTSRVFATGFSFGGMITYSLSTNHQKDLRAAVGIAPANYNIYLPTNTHEPIPYMSTTGMSDTTCPWDGGNNRGAKYAAIGHAMDNGCIDPGDHPHDHGRQQDASLLRLPGVPARLSGQGVHLRRRAHRRSRRRWHW